MSAPRTLYDKIFDDHTVDRQDDGTCLLYIDRHLVHEVTSPQAFEGLKLAGRKPWRVAANLVVADHNVPTTDRAHGIADPVSRLQVETLDANAQEYGLTYFSMRDKRQGIVHVIGPEQGATLPGMTVVCGDSHTSTHGAFGCLAHGIGTGDINGDGRTDILSATGWWEQPETLNKGKTWKYHPFAFGRYKNRATNIGGSVMAVYDVNGDGLNDVVSNLNVHGFGLAWFEQKKDGAGNISFVRHMINDDYSQKSAGDVTFSQGHAATFADIDNDGIMDYIVGKRFFTHLDNMFDPDAYGPPVLYWYRTVRNKNAPGGAEFVPELIHNRSGVGSQVTAIDLNNDGAMDLLTSNNRGTFIFWNIGTQKR